MIGKSVSHYKILEELGRGGMGVVYKAHDTKLDRDVALKFLPPHITVTESDKARFLQEAKAAAAINHPNVCTIYDIIEHEDQQFIVMEYVEGTTLRQLKMPNDQIQIKNNIDYALQIAVALEAAHEAGIVHRDVKSDNIMITTNNQVKVMDFGLAKLKGSVKLTKSSSTVGTLAYMSPEQIDGREIDARSDIFSFGIVLYEMLTGQLPFKGDYEAALMYAILNDQPEPVEKHLPDISSELLHILNRSLEKDPDERYQSMRDMVIDLRRLKRDTVNNSHIYSAPTQTDKSSKIISGFKKFRIPVIALFLMLSIVIVYLATINESEQPNERIQIAVIDFNNETDESELNGLSGMLITALEQSKILSVLTRSRMFDILKQLNINEIDRIDESLGRRICKEARIKTLATASIRKFGKLYTIDFKVLNVDKNEYLFTSKEQGEGQESIPAMIDNLSEDLRKGLRETASAIEASTTNVAEITSPNLEAYQHYFKGEELIDNLNFKMAREEFQKAIKLDPTFGLAYYRLAYAIDWEANPKSSAKYISKAISLLNRIPEKDRYLVRAQHARIENGMEAGVAILKEMLKIYPDDKEMLYNIGDWSYHVGHFNMAKQYLERVLKMDPIFVRALQHLTWTYRDLGMYESMFSTAKEYNSVTDSKESFDLLSDAYIELGKFNEGLQFINNLRETYPERHYLASLVAKFYIFQNCYDEAEKELKSLIGKEKPQRSKLLGHMILANFYNYVGKLRESINSCEYLTEFFWQKKDTSLATYWQVMKGLRIYSGGGNREAADIEIRKTFPYQENIDYMLYWTSLTFYYVIEGQFRLAESMAKSTHFNWWYLSVLSLIHNQRLECAESEALMDTVYQSVRGGVKILLLYQLAECQYKKHEYNKAIQSLQKMQSLHYTEFGFRALYYPKSFFLLGKIYEKIGEYEPALRNYKKFLDMWKNADADLPELIDAKKRFKNLRRMSSTL